MVVVDATLKPGRRTRRLNAPDQPRIRQRRERVIDRLPRNRAYARHCEFPHGISTRVGVSPHRLKDGQTLRCHLKPAGTQVIG
jgi:hypothetical protein